MKKEIIEKMTSIVEGCMSSYKSDYYKYDKPAVESSNKPFLWVVSRTHTALHFLRSLIVDGYDKSEIDDYCYIFYVLTGGASIRYYIDDVMKGNGKLYYCNGEVLVEMEPCKAIAILDAFDDMARAEFVGRYGGIPRRKTVHLRLNPYFSDENWLIKELKYAKELGDTSLRDCLRSLGRHRRCHLHHVIFLTPYTPAHSIYFSEQINYDTRGVGGIIYDETPYNGRHWSIHT